MLLGALTKATLKLEAVVRESFGIELNLGDTPALQASYLSGVMVVTVT